MEGLLERIVDTPHLARAVASLQPEVLHQIIQRCGLEDCAGLIALATPQQLTRVFDLDLWRSDRPGLDEQFDAGRFGRWVEVLLEQGTAAAARTVAGLEADLITTALRQHIRVFDLATVSTFMTTDGELRVGMIRAEAAASCEIGGFVVDAVRTDAWDTIVTLLRALSEERPGYFADVMSGCRALSSSHDEVDGLDDLLTDADQDLFDLASDREERRVGHGFVTPAQAGAFLQMARQVQMRAGSIPRNPIAAALFRERLEAAPGEASGVLVDLLVETGVMTRQPRALLEGADRGPSRLAFVKAYLRAADEGEERASELAFLANALMAGCSLQGRPFTAREASDAVTAVCNLGLENWPPHCLPASDLIAAFEVGWTVLHRDACNYAAQHLIEILSTLRCSDRELYFGLESLRSALVSGCRDDAPWRARAALDVMVALDMTAWAAMLGLIAECPVLHASVDATQRPGTHAIEADAFEFISENSQIAAVHAFIESLPRLLTA